MTDAPLGPVQAARIIDRGYRNYRGKRAGQFGAIRTVYKQAIQRALGIRRSIWAKIFPLAAVLISYVPAIVLIGINAIVPQADSINLPSYGSYFGFIQLAILVIVAFVAPEILCTDRRSGMLGLYLASALDRDTYLIAKAAATFTVLSLLTIGPPLFLLIGSMLQGVGPDGPAGAAGTFARILGAGAAVSITFTAISMAIASFTDRYIFASAATLAFFLGSIISVGTIVEVMKMSELWLSLDPNAATFVLASRVHGLATQPTDMTLLACLASAAIWTIVGGFIVRIRYQLLDVTR